MKAISEWFIFTLALALVFVFALASASSTRADAESDCLNYEDTLSLLYVAARSEDAQLLDSAIELSGKEAQVYLARTGHPDPASAQTVYTHAVLAVTQGADGQPELTAVAVILPFDAGGCNVTPGGARMDPDSGRFFRGLHDYKRAQSLIKDLSVGI